MFTPFTVGIKPAGLKYIHKAVQPSLYLVLEHFQLPQPETKHPRAVTPLHALYSAVSADACAFKTLHVNGIARHVAFCVRLLPLRIMLSWGIQTIKDTANAPFLCS